MTTFRLGKKPPRIDRRTLRLGRYLAPGLPPPPPTSALYTNVSRWPMYLNDQLGDCTMAGAAHLIGEWTANTAANHQPEVFPDTEIREDYLELTGGPDDGLDLLTVLNWWSRTGFVTPKGSDTIAAYAAVEPANNTEAMDAIYLLGGLYVGLALPDFAANPPDGNLLDVPWSVPQGGVAANPPNPQNGHCVAAVGYDPRNLYVVTWGAVKAMSWPFYDAYSDESFALLSPADWVPSGESPTGLDLQQLQQDLQAIRSTSP